MSIKVVYNTCYGGFSISEEAIKWLSEHGIETGRYPDLDRHDPILVQCVEELGEKADGDCASLCVYELKGNKYRIDEYDGSETVMEPDDYHWIVVE